MMKRHCKSRADWRVQLGKAAERISAHYRLDCDYGTAIVVCFEEGGSEPINLCEKHAEELERSGKNRQSVRAIAPVPAPMPRLDHGNQNTTRSDATRSDEQSAAREVVHATPKASVSLETASGLAKTNAVRAADMRAADVRAPEVQATEVRATEIRATDVRATEARAAKDPSPRLPARDLTYGNPVKALVDETIWNMGTGDYGAYRTALREGKSVSEAAQAAGGQMAVVHRKIGDYTRKLEAVLSESKAIINVREAIDTPLEQAILEIISDDAISETEKDVAMQQLGILEAWVKRGLSEEMTLLDASRIVREIGDRLNWGGSNRGDNAGISEKLKPAYRALFSSLKSAIYNGVPDAQNVLNRLVNLYAVKSELENMPMMRELNPVTA